MSAIDKILEERRNKSSDESVAEAGKFYSMISVEGGDENFLELRFREGLKTCFAYKDLTFFNFDPEENCIDLEFASFLVTLRGRGLGEKLFHGFKSKQVSWVKEADTDFEDDDSFETYISEITITPPEGTGEEEED
ncbi:MAG: hypothetical protein AAGA58_19190 [Verrucomicrobiota bacterium]